MRPPQKSTQQNKEHDSGLSSSSESDFEPDSEGDECVYAAAPLAGAISQESHFETPLLLHMVEVREGKDFIVVGLGSDYQDEDSQAEAY